MKLVFASHNQGKVDEVAALLQLPSIEVLSLDEVGLGEFEIEETGSTFSENALLKAQTVAEKTNTLTLADDSGLEVTVLDGKPGVYSARFISGTDLDRCNEILRLLKDEQDRKARFISVLCLYNPVSQEKLFFEGTVEGVIGAEVKGSSGFGYDPIFIPTGYTETFAQLGSSVKNKLSHRARALEKVKAFFHEQ